MDGFSQFLNKLMGFPNSQTNGWVSPVPRQMDGFSQLSLLLFPAVPRAEPQQEQTNILSFLEPGTSLAPSASLLQVLLPGCYLGWLWLLMITQGAVPSGEPSLALP